MLTSAPRRLCAPSFVLLRASLLVSLLFAAPHAYAGYYAAAYSGGTNATVGFPNESGVSDRNAGLQHTNTAAGSLYRVQSFGHGHALHN